MDAIVGVWLSSVLGAGAFSAAGYVLGQRGVVVPGLALPPSPVAEAARPPLAEAPPSRGEDPVVTVVRDRDDALPGDATPTPPAFPAALAAAGSAEARGSVAPPRDAEDEVERPTVIPTLAEAAAIAASSSTIPPPRPASIRIDGGLDLAAQRLELELAGAREELREARERATRATAQAGAAEAKSRELERQVEVLRIELRQEVAARATASARAEELGDRLASASEDAASLRHKVTTLDRQCRQLREALQGRVRALTTSEWHRRRELEEAEEVRVKLKDVFDKLERSSSLPPAPPSSPPPAGTPMPRPAAVPGGGLGAEERAELARLREENKDLRAQVLGSLAPKPRPSSRRSSPEIDLELYRGMLARVGDLPGIRAAVIADELGSLVLGAGELAEGLAAFGAFIRDASERTERLLPLDVIDEIALRDRAGVTFTTRLLTTGQAELSLVMLGAGEMPVTSASRIVDSLLRDHI